MRDVDLIDGACLEAFGLPRVRWNIVRDYLAKNGLGSDPQQWTHLQRQWLGRTAMALGEGFEVRESEHFLFLVRGYAVWIPEQLESIYARIMNLAGEVNWAASPAKAVIVILAGEARYRQFIRYYRDDGMPTESAGVCVTGEFPLVAIPSLSGFKRIIAHELTHAYFAPLPLPRWLSEGVAQRIDRLIAVKQQMDHNATVRQHHRAYWKRVGIQMFWSGAAFVHRRVNDQMLLAYHLAELLASHLINDNAVAFQALVRSAKRDDAGEAATSELYGKGLRDALTELLGDGDWSPQPQEWLVVANQTEL